MVFAAPAAGPVEAPSAALPPGGEQGSASVVVLDHQRGELVERLQIGRRESALEPDGCLSSGLLIVGFAIAGGRGDRSFYEGVSTFSESLPFLGFCQPVLHFFLGKRSPLAAHEFKGSEPILRIHAKPRPKEYA